MSALPCPMPWIKNAVFGIGSVVAATALEYVEYPAALCARTRKPYVVLGWRFVMPVLRRVAAVPMSVKVAAPATCDSTRIAVASGALFVQIRFTWLDEIAVACRFVGAAGSDWSVVTEILCGKWGEKHTPPRTAP